ncbi:MAG: hypothetical protein VB855_03245, partial [Pirellulaceae bacterium]
HHLGSHAFSAAHAATWITHTTAHTTAHATTWITHATAHATTWITHATAHATAHVATHVATTTTIRRITLRRSLGYRLAFVTTAERE